jgi:integrase-like protein
LRVERVRGRSGTPSTACLREVLDQARRGELPGQVRIGAAFRDAAAEWLRFIEEDRERKPSTLVDYRSALKAHLLPAFGERPLESIEPSDIEEWRRSLCRFVEPIQEQAAHPDARDLPAGPDRLGPFCESLGARREASDEGER